MSPFEVIMLVCFGASWPFAIAKTLKAKNPAGKSFLFLTLLFIGYVSGSVNKVLHEPGNKILYLYIANGLMVLFDLIMSIYYARKNRRV